MNAFCYVCHKTGHATVRHDPFGNHRLTRHRQVLRTPATINPDDRDRWRGFAQSYAHLGRDVESFVYDAHDLSAFGRHARRATTFVGMEAEIAAFRAELGDIFPAPAAQPLPMVRFSQAGVASARGAL